MATDPVVAWLDSAPAHFDPPAVTVRIDREAYAAAIREARAMRDASEDFGPEYTRDMLAAR